MTDSGKTFTCSGRKKKHHPSIYALAQLAQGHVLVFTCDCGAKKELTRRTFARSRKTATKAEE